MNEPQKPPEYLRIEITPKKAGGDKVNIKLPLFMARLGLKFASLVPDKILLPIQQHLKNRGIDFDITQVNPDNADRFFTALTDIDIHVDNEKETIHVYCQ